MYVDCVRNKNICKLYNVPDVPSFRYIAPGSDSAVDDGLTSVRGENLVGYMNLKCGIVLRRGVRGRNALPRERQLRRDVRPNQRAGLDGSPVHEQRRDDDADVMS